MFKVLIEEKQIKIEFMDNLNISKGEYFVNVVCFGEKESNPYYLQIEYKTFYVKGYDKELYDKGLLYA